MSDTMRIINLFLDVENGYPVVSVDDASKKPTRETLYLNTQVLYRCHLLNADKTYFTPPGTAIWKFGINNNMDSSPTGKAVTLNADFNDPADWSGVAVAGGKICWPIDLTQALLRAFMALSTTSTTGSTPMYACLWMQPAGGSWDLKCQWQIDMMPIAIDPTTASPTSSDTIETLAHALATFVQKAEDGAWHRRVNGQDYDYCADDDTWHARVVKLVDGIHVYTPGPAVTL